MRSRNDVATRLTLGLLALAWLAIPALAELPVLPEDVRRNVVRRVDDRFSVSIVIGLVNADGASYFAHGTTALSGGVTPDEHTVYEIGSITKVFTGTLLADLVEKEVVALDDPVASYLPEGVSVPTRGETPIRLVDLATHRSGLPRMPDNFDPEDPLNPFADYTVEDLYAFLGSYQLTRDVGERHEYSNLGMGLLGHVLERVSGMGYERLVKERIAEPLGMTSTGITLTSELKARMARPYSMTVEVKPWDIPTLAGAGALRSTAADMVAFLAANMGLSETSLAGAMTLAQQVRSEGDSPGLRVGLGWHVLGEGEDEIVWHNGETGGYHAFAGFLRDGSLGVVVLANSSGSIDDVGLHVLNPSIPLSVKQKSKRIPLFKRD